MKKVLVILLLLVYGASSSGMTLHFHYCCGKLKAVDLTSPRHKGCGKGMDLTMAGGKACCGDKQFSLKIKGEQSPAKIFKAPFQSTAAKVAMESVVKQLPARPAKLIPEVFGPPPLDKDINRLFCIYRI